MFWFLGGYVGPGGIGDGGLYFNCTGGAARYIDLKIFGINHIYPYPTCQDPYMCPPFDPEGALGNLTSIFLCFLGMQCGRILITHKDPIQRMSRWVIWGILFASLGTLLCKGDQNGGWIPLNKNLWSPSFIFVMVSFYFFFPPDRVLCVTFRI